MVVYTRNITINAGTYFEFIFPSVRNSDNSILNLNGYTGVSKIKKSANSLSSTANFNVSIVDAAKGILKISLDSGVTSRLASGRYCYDVLINDGNEIIKVFEGTALVNPGVTGSLDSEELYGCLTTVGIASYAKVAGVATYANYANIAGIATYANYANIAGIATYAKAAGIATYSTSSGIATYAKAAGIATYSTSSGIATYANSSGVSTNLKGGIAYQIPYQSAIDTTQFIPVGNIGEVLISNGGIEAPNWSNVSGGYNVAFANTATLARHVIGGIASVSSLNVTGISSLGNVRINAGIITAISGVVTYYGDGRGLTGISSSSIVGVVSASTYAATAGIANATKDTINNSYLDSVNLDKILSLEEAADFLRKTTMGPTWEEIENLYALGSRRKWLIDQMSSSFDNSKFSEWDTTVTPKVAKAGWVGSVALSYACPVNPNGGSDPVGIATSIGIKNWVIIGEPTTIRVMLGAFLRNNSPDEPVYKDSRKSFLCKVLWILNKFIPVSVPGGGFISNGYAWTISSWYSSLARYAFTTYADLLEEVTYSQGMSLMLTYIKNQKEIGDTLPDENYAREIMQLFTIGLYELNIDGTYKLDANGEKIPTYTNVDIEQMARVFTGLVRWDRPDSYYTDNSKASSIASGGTLDTQVSRSFLTGYNVGGAYATAGSSVSYPPGVAPRLRHYEPWYEFGAKNALNGVVGIASSTPPKENIRLAIEQLISHPNCAPFVAKNLIQLSTTSNPSKEYVARVAKVFLNNGKNIVGDLPSVWIAIFTDPEANQTINTNTKYGRVRDGFEMYSNVVRTFDRRSSITYVDPATIVPPTTPNFANYVFFREDLNRPAVDNDLQSPTTSGITTFTRIMQDSSRLSALGTWPYSAPSIFSYYSKDYTTGSADDWGIVVPELDSMSASTKISIIGTLDQLALSREPTDSKASSNLLSASYSVVLGSTLAGPAKDLVDRLALLLCGNNLSEDKKSLITSTIVGMSVATQVQQQNRVAVALQLIFRSTEFWTL